MTNPTGARPLDGLRVLEMGQLLAGPFAASMLGYFGAEVIKIEPPGTGDPIRTWRVMKDGVSLWWHSLGRNKKSVTLDLRQPKGRQIARQLALKSDIIVENFRPGTLEKWGMGPAELWQENPGLIYGRISGYGQNGPYATKPGFASVCEGIGGLRYVNGFPGEAPVRPNLSLGDTLAGIHCVLGILLAVINRSQDPQKRGQVVDAALYESVFNLMEGVVPEYSGAGVVREPSGSTLTGIVPTNTYRCRDGKFVIIGGNGDSIYKRLMNAMGRPDLADDPRMANNAGRVQHEKELDAAISAWTSSLDSSDVLAVLEKADVPCGPIYSVVDMLKDPHFNARGLFEQVQVNGAPLTIPAMLPMLTATPGRTDWPGPDIGQHNGEVLGGLLGLGDADLAALQRDGIV
ncbi:MAG: CoA transferase [Chromatiales bacterium]|jgi:crotonobetainyl-CoA:carnitine CoA-transferase CaiB-like acyl-CoA transferase|nr:CoA transferase [Chromatiales bacterium]